MLRTLIQKEIMHHILSVRFVALLVMCVLLIPLTLLINYRNYQQDLVDYQEAVKLANIEETTVNPKMSLEPEIEVSKLFLKPTPLATIALGETFRQSAVDVLLLCFFSVTLTTIAFLKFFRLDI